MYGEATGGNYVPLDWDEEQQEELGKGVEEEEDLHRVDTAVAEQNPEYWHILKLVKVKKHKLPLLCCNGQPK